VNTLPDRVPLAAAPFLLSPGTVHVWSVDLNRPDDEARAFAILAADEQGRATRFRFERDRRRFTVARAALRTLLGHYVSQPAPGIAFIYGQNGKPALACPGPHFNITHSEELAVIALSAEVPLGVDVEKLDRVVDQTLLRPGFASLTERVAFAAMVPAFRQQALLHWWTRKEALLKALGSGLSLPLDGFDVSIAPGDARLLGARLPEFSGAWSLQDIRPAPGYLGAIAVPGSAPEIVARPFGPVQR
jgi:4'-phosphopantetheinyl transferase